MSFRKSYQNLKCAYSLPGHSTSINLAQRVTQVGDDTFLRILDVFVIVRNDTNHDTFMQHNASNTTTITQRLKTK